MPLHRLLGIILLFVYCLSVSQQLYARSNVENGSRTESNTNGGETALAAPTEPLAVAPLPSTADVSMPENADVANALTWYLAELHINGNVADDFVDVGVDAAGQLYLPAGALLQAGEATVEQPDPATLQLRINNTEQFLNIDITKQRVAMTSETRPLHDSEVIEHDGQVFVLSSLFNAAFEATTQFSADIQTLNLTTTRPWPRDLRVAREYRWQNPQENEIDPVEPVVVNYDYQLLGSPHADIDLAWGMSAQNTFSNQYNMLLMSEALYMTNVLVTSGSAAKPFEHVRLQSGRQDLRGNVFGIASLYDVQFGDVSGQSVPLVGSVPDGRGVRFQAAPLSRTTNFDATEIEGDAPVGWQAELYVGMQLYSFQQIGTDGRFRFTNIPIGYGSNQVKVVLYGPQGQTREVNYQKDISSNIVPPGEFQSYGYLAQNQHTMLGIDEENSPNSRQVGAVGNLQLDYGVSHWLSIGAFVARSELNNRSVLPMTDAPVSALTPLANLHSPNPVPPQYSAIAQDYYGVELRPVLNNVSLLGGIVQQKGAGQGYYGRIYVPLRFLPLSMDYEHYAADYLSAHSLSGMGLVRDRIKARVGLPLNSLTDALGYASIALSTEQTYSGNQQFDAELNYSHRLGRVFFTHFFDYQQEKTQNIASQPEKQYRLLASYQQDLFDFRAEAEYNLGPQTAFESANFSALWRYNDNNSASVALSYTPHGGVGSALYINQDLNFSTLSVGVSRTTEGEYTLSAGLSFELGYQSDQGLTLQSSKDMYSGSAAVVLQKQDDDGRISPLNQIGISVNDVSQDRLSDQSGKIVLGKLAANNPATLKIDTDALPDPFLIPEYPKVEIWPRAGQTIPITLKVLNSKTISGVVRRKNSQGDSVPIEGMKIQFLNPNGRVQAETETLSDGYYSVDSLYIGKWQLRINPQNVLSAAQKKAVTLPFNIIKGNQSSDINIAVLSDGSVIRE